MRFGYEYVESALHSQGKNLIVIDNKELTRKVYNASLIHPTNYICFFVYGLRVALIELITVT